MSLVEMTAHPWVTAELGQLASRRMLASQQRWSPQQHNRTLLCDTKEGCV